jgi:TRAP transporter TAXI family solute receptor
VISTRIIRRWFAWSVLALLIVCVITWIATRETLPPKIRIGSAKPGGLYFRFANALEPLLHKRANCAVDVIETDGSVENCRLLRENKVDLAILQAGAVKLAIPQIGASDASRIAALAPLYHDVVHVIVRSDSGIKTLKDLEGKNVSLGPTESGMRKTAEAILKHYHVDVETLLRTEEYFLSLQKDNSMDAAIVTTGMPNPDLGTLLNGGTFSLMPILQGKALQIKHPYFTLDEIPRGLFAPGVPKEPVTTVATTAFLAARADAKALLVTTVLTTLYEDYHPSLYENYHSSKYPPIVPLNDACNWSTVPLHPAALSYRDPHRGLQLFGKFLELLAALKELIFALVGVLYLAWTLWRNLKQKEEEDVYRLQNEKLDLLLNKTMRIERVHMETDDASELQTYLDEVTHIKLKALEELTDNRLRGDRQFSIFLMQCSNLIRKIQEKCIFHRNRQE